ncbi:MAG: choice-of-anchor J domain-containing protein, partial [Pyrinomonadaceae bacterium]
MKNTVGSIFGWSRRNYVLLSLVLALAGFGSIAFRATAQSGNDPTTESRSSQPAGDAPVQKQESADVVSPFLAPNTAGFTEGFENVAYPPAGWFALNESTAIGTNTQCWNRFTTTPWAPRTGVGHTGANFNCTTGNNTISGWLITPLIDFNNGDTITFWTRKASTDTFPDRLELRVCLTGANCGTTNADFTSSTDVEDYTTVLVSVNPTLVTGVYPTTFTQFTGTISGLPGTTQGRAAFRYFVTNGGPSGSNSDIISIDDVVYTPAAPPTINVNTVDQEVNNDGDCSLQEAITAANTNAIVDACTAGVGSDTIVLPPGTYQMTGLSGDPASVPQAANPAITSPITIQGNGAIIDGGAGLRAFTVMGAGSLTLQNLIIRDFAVTGGNGANGGGGGLGAGGAVYVNSGGTLTADTCTFENNSATGGNGSTKSGNTGGGGGGIGGSGGGIFGAGNAGGGGGGSFGNGGQGSNGGGGGGGTFQNGVDDGGAGGLNCGGAGGTFSATPNGGPGTCSGGGGGGGGRGTTVVGGIG